MVFIKRVPKWQMSLHKIHKKKKKIKLLDKCPTKSEKMGSWILCMTHILHGNSK